MPHYAVIDTNVWISALLSKNADSATVKVMNAVFDGKIIPLYHPEILDEYNDVLHRSKFHLQDTTIRKVLQAIRQYGVEVYPQPTGELLVDMDDLIFYEVVMEKREEGAVLVTGNQKHFPARSFIITPSEMIELLEREKQKNFN